MRRALTIALFVVCLLLSPLAVQVSFSATLPPQHGQYVARVIELVNVERQRVGRPPLAANTALTRGAQDYAGVMADTACFSHRCGSTLVERINGSGYTNWTAAGENIAMGQSSPESVMAAWMGSQGHRDNLLGVNYKHIGVGLATRTDGQLVWVQMFGASTTQVGVTPTVVPTSTPTPAPTATPVPGQPLGCTPRPAFNVRSRTTAPGVLEVTVTAGTTNGPTRNALAAVRFGSVANGTVDVNGHGRVTSNTTVRMASGVQQVTFVVRRAAPGTPTTVPLVLTDACGEWRTFVGAGANAF